MAAKVAPSAGADEPFSFTTFTKPVPTTPPMMGYDAAYVARKKEVLPLVSIPHRLWFFFYSGVVHNTHQLSSVGR